MEALSTLGTHVHSYSFLVIKDHYGKAAQVIGADEDQQKPWVDRTKFSTFMGVIIMANAITVGIETEQVEEQLWMGITNNFFVLVYIFEFTARFYYHGSESRIIACKIHPYMLVPTWCAATQRDIRSEGNRTKSAYYY